MLNIVCIYIYIKYSIAYNMQLKREILELSFLFSYVFVYMVFKTVASPGHYFH